MSRLFISLALLAISLTLVECRSHSHASMNASDSSMLLTKGSGYGKDECGGRDFGTAGDFGYYLFVQSWPAEFCASHTSYPGCSNPTAWQQTNLTIHGMWPNYDSPRSGHSWPQCCQSSYGQDFSSAIFNQYKPSFLTYWPNEQDPTGHDLSNSLWEHEWNKHGTCSGLPQQQYFTQAFNFAQFMSTADAITQNIGGSTTTQAILRYYGATCSAGQDCAVGLTCANGNSLIGVITCWTKDFKQMVCPSSTFGNAQCQDGAIQIASF